MAPESQSSGAVGATALAKWMDAVREHKTALVAVALLALTPLLYSAAVQRRRSQRRFQASGVKLSAAERSAVCTLYRSTLHAAKHQRSSSPGRLSEEGAGPARPDWARVLRGGISAIGNQDCQDPAEMFGLRMEAEGQQVELEDFEMVFKQMKADGIDERTVLAICRHAMLSEQAHHTAQLAAMGRKAAERRRSEHKAAEDATESSRAAQAASADEVPERLWALFPSLRGPRHTSGTTLRLEAAELRKVVTQAREVVSSEGIAEAVSLSAVEGQGQVEAIDEEGVDALRRAKPTDGSLLSSVESPSTA